MAVATALRSLELRDFSGGLNLRASPSELAPNETPDCLNVAIDDRGGLIKRLGYTKDTGMSALSADISNFFYSKVLGQLIVQKGTDVQRRTGVATFSNIKTFTTSARVTFAEFNDKLLMLHPVDGLFAFSSALALTGPLGSRKGVAIAVWQNKVHIAVGTAVTAERTRIYCSALGDETGWTVGTNGAASNDLREVDDSPLVALHVAGGGALLAFKQSSTYRVVDSTNLSYATIDADTGTCSALSVASFEGLVCSFDDHGIFVTDGLSELRNVSQQLAPLMNRSQLNLANADKFCATATPDGTFLISLQRSGQTTNGLTLHYSPRYGWIVPYDFGAAAFALIQGAENQLWHAAPGSARVIYRTFTGGSDDGTAIASRWQSRWFEPAEGYLTRVQHVRPAGIGDFNLIMLRDYSQVGGELMQFSVATGTGFVWGTGVWGVDSWGGSVYEGYDDFFPRLTAKSVSFRVEETSSLTRAGPLPIGAGVTTELGAWALYEVLANYSTLEAL